MSLLDTASLLLTPNAYKEGKLYSVIPSDGSGDFTFTRATTATRVNSDGLVELVPYNLLTYSEQFENAIWTKVNSSVTANAETAPNGTLTADLFNSNGTLNNHRLDQALAFVPTTKTYSVYAKANDASFIQISAAFNTDSWVNFDLSNGTLSNQGSGYIGSISNVGNGWYLCSVYTADGAATSLRISIVTNLSSARIETNSISGGVYIWGAQVNEGSALPYQKTETRLNIPRLDYSLGGCPNILLEPQRTNLALQSSSFDSATWSKANSTITANATTAPDGTTTADKLITSSGLTQGRFAINPSLSNTVYSVSIYAKQSQNLSLRIGVDGGYSCYYNLSTGTVGTQTNATGTITNVGDGWYRCTFTFTLAIAGTPFINYIIVNNNESLYTGDGTSGIFIWGAQLEAGSYATSYIPTTTASVTRNAEILNKTGISSLIGQTEGTVFLDFVKNNNDLGIIQISDGTTANRIYLGINNTNIIAQVRSGGGAAQAAFTVAATNNTRYKCAIAYKSNDFVLYINGNQEGISTSGLVPVSFSQFQTSDIGSAIFVNPTNSTALWKERLTNDQLAQLTTI